jgi:hypothetical protein
MRRVRYVARLKSAAAGEAGKSKAVMSGESSLSVSVSVSVSSKRIGEQQQARGLLESLAGKGEEEEQEKKR